MTNILNVVIRKLEQSNSRKIINLVTKGRVTGLPRFVTIGFVCFKGRVYVRTSHETNWYKNIQVNPNVKVIVGEEELISVAKPVTNEILKETLQKKYLMRYKIFDIYANLLKLRGDRHFFELEDMSKISCN